MIVSDGKLTGKAMEEGVHVLWYPLVVQLTNNNNNNNNNNNKR
jgi:hypothetical protein